MNYEEFELLCNKQDKELKEAIARLNKFMRQTEKSLIDLAFATYPQTKKHKKLFIKPLKEDVHEQILGITNTIDYYLYMPTLPDDSKENPEDYKVPNLDEWVSVEQELQNYLKKECTPPHSKFLIRELRKVFKNEREEKTFLFICHRKILELIYVHFPEMVDFSPNAIRKLNFSAYISAHSYQTAFYFLAF